MLDTVLAHNRKWHLRWVEATIMNVGATSPSLFGAQVKAWKTKVVLDVVDQSLEAAREAREAAAAERARREAEREREEVRVQREKRTREEIEAEDARRLVELHRMQARDAQRAVLSEQSA